MQVAKPIVELYDFPGLLVNMDPRDLPVGAAEDQTNAAIMVAGELQVRRGLKEVSFEA